MTTKVKGLYALVVYEKSEKQVKNKGARGSKETQTYYDILELSLIPKKHRVVGDRTRVTWVDQSTKKTSCHYVVIQKISENRDELLSMCPVDAATGEVASAETKIFTEEVLTERKKLQDGKKADNVARSQAREEIENQIANDCGIWNDVKPLDDHLPLKKLLPISKEASRSQSQSMENSAKDSSYATPPLGLLPLISKPGLIPAALSIEETEEKAPGVKASPDKISLSPESSHMTQDADGKIIKPNEKKFWDAMKSLAAVATPDNIEFLDSVVTSLKASLISSTTESSLEKPEPSYEIAERYKKSGKDTVPIYAGINFYLFSGVKNAIQKKSYVYNKVTRNLEKCWKLLVRQCLLEVYASYLGKYSAKGTKGNQRPAIDSDLYKGLLYWARDWYGDEIDEDEYVEFINKSAYNKRKSSNQRTTKKNIMNAEEDDAHSTSSKSCEKKTQKREKRKTDQQKRETLSNPLKEKLSVKPADGESQSSSLEASQNFVQSSLEASPNVNLKPLMTHVEEVSQKITLKDGHTVVQDNALMYVEPRYQNASQQQLQRSDERNFDGSLTQHWDQPFNQKLVVPSEKAACPVPSSSVLHSQGSVSFDRYNQYDQNLFNSPHPPNTQYLNNFQPTHYQNSQYFRYPTYESINYPEYHPLQNRETEKTQTSASPQSRYSSEMEYTSL